MVVRPLSTSLTSLSSKFTTSSNYSSNSVFLSPVRVTIPSGRSLKLGRRHRMLVPVPKAGGPPSTNTLLFAFFLPFSLLVGTIFAAFRVGDQLDRKYLEEMEMNIAIMEENDIDIDELSEEYEEENEDEVENDELITASGAQSRQKQEL